MYRWFLGWSLLWCQLPVEAFPFRFVQEAQWDALKRLPSAVWGDLARLDVSRLNLPDWKRSLPPAAMLAFEEAYAHYELLHLSVPQILTQVEETYPQTPQADLAQFYRAKVLFLYRDYVAAYAALHDLPATGLPTLYADEILFMKGYAAYQMGRTPEALATLEPLARKKSPFQEVASYYAGLVCYEKAYFKKAADYLIPIENTSPYRNQAPYWAVQSLILAQNWTRLMNYLEELRQKPYVLFRRDSTFMMAGIALAVEGLCDQAEKAFQEISYSEAPFWLGICELKNHNSAKSLSYFQSLGDVDGPLREYVTFWSAYAHAAQGNWEEAYALWKKSYDAGFLAQESLYGLLIAAAQAGLDEKILTYAPLFLQTYAGSPYAKNVRLVAAAGLLRRMPQKSLFFLDTLSQGAPLRAAAYLHWAQKEPDTALWAYTQAEKMGLEPYATYALLGKAEYLFQKQAYFEAEKAYRKLQRKNLPRPLAKAVDMALGWTYLMQQKYDAAEKLFYRLYVHADTLKFEAGLRWADALFAQKKYDAALGAYQEVLAMAPQYSYIYYQIGTILQRQQRYTQAVAFLRNAPLEKPYGDKILYLLAEIELTWLSRADSALMVLDRLKRLFPGSTLLARAYLLEAVAHSQKGNTALAQEAARKALTTAHKGEDLADALNLLKDLLAYEEFQPLYQAYLPKLHPSQAEELNLGLALTWVETQRWAQAEKALTEHLQRYPAHPTTGRALLALAKTHIALENYEAAQKTYFQLTHDVALATQAWEGILQVGLQKRDTHLARQAISQLMQILPPGGYRRVEVSLLWASLSPPARAESLYKALGQDSSLTPYLKSQWALEVAKFLKASNPDSAEKLLLLVENQATAGIAAQALLVRCQLLYQQERWDDFKKAVFSFREKFKEQNFPKAQAYALLAQMYLKQNKISSAKRTLESLRDAAPEPVQSWAQKTLDSLSTIPPSPKPERKKKGK
ncbi:MAG: tetratricopeptide repeat protein [Bacteroidia bacterium]